MQETQGVCVSAYKTYEFPAFFTEKSGCKVWTVILYNLIAFSNLILFSSEKTWYYLLVSFSSKIGVVHLKNIILHESI